MKSSNLSRRPSKSKQKNESKQDHDDPMREAIVRFIESLRTGEVVSYGEAAARAGYPRRHRVVGQLLSMSGDALPWWRVVYNDGRLPPVQPTLQEQKLMEEGVKVEGFRVVRAKYGRFANPND